MEALLGLFSPLIRIADKFFAKEVRVIEQGDAANLGAKGGLYWSKPEKVSGRREEGYREFTTRTWYLRPTVYRDKLGGVLLIKPENDKGG